MGLAILAAFFMWPGVAEMVVLQVRLLTGLTPTRARYVSPWRPASMCRGLAEASVEVSEQDFLWLATRSGGRDVDALVAAAVTSHRYRAGYHELAFYTFDTLSDVAPHDPRSWAAVVYQRQLSLYDAAFHDHQGPTDKLDAHAYRHLDEAVKHGRSLEPDNAFWDLVEMALAVADEDDPRAVQVLLRGADKPRFDDHRQAVRATVVRACRKLSLSDYRAKVSALELFGPCPSVFFSHALARHAAGIAVQLEQDGQPAEAVRLYAAALRLDRRSAASSPVLQRPGRNNTARRSRPRRPGRVTGRHWPGRHAPSIASRPLPANRARTISPQWPRRRMLRVPKAGRSTSQPGAKTSSRGCTFCWRPSSGGSNCWPWRNS